MYYIATPLKINITPETWWLKDYTKLFGEVPEIRDELFFTSGLVTFDLPGTLNNQFFMVVSIGWFKIFTWEMVGNHQTSIYKWLFRVPGLNAFFWWNTTWAMAPFKNTTFEALSRHFLHAWSIGLPTNDLVNVNPEQRWKPWNDIPLNPGWLIGIRDPYIGLWNNPYITG